MTRIYLGNLPARTTDDDLRQLLARDGRTVTLVNIKRNGTSGKPRGFAFVDMGSQEEAEAAIRDLQGAEMDGRALKVGFAKELPSRRGSSEGWQGGGHGRFGGSWRR